MKITDKMRLNWLQRKKDFMDSGCVFSANPSDGSIQVYDSPEADIDGSCHLKIREAIDEAMRKEPKS